MPSNEYNEQGYKAWGEIRRTTKRREIEEALEEELESYVDIDFDDEV